MLDALNQDSTAHAEKVLGAQRHSAWDNVAVRDAVEKLAASCDAAIEAMRQCLYFFAQATWLQSRFPAAEIVAVSGLGAAVTRTQIDSPLRWTT